MPETQIPGLQNTSAERRNSKFHKSLDILDFFVKVIAVFMFIMIAQYSAVIRVHSWNWLKNFMAK